MLSGQIFWIGMAAILSQTGHVASHGRLIQPAQRSSAWRYGYNNPENYNDNELFCGGFDVQWNQTDGRCGVCGDPYNAQVKPNEDVDGLYVVNGVITGSYVQGGVVNTEVELTAYHKGWFEFRLCPLATTTTKVTQECLNQNVLTVEGTNTTRIQLEEIKTGLGPGVYMINLRLPTTITCERCVLQWKYNTGNSWNCDSEGCGIGRGPQENFVNCADIQINDEGTENAPTDSSSTVSQSATMTALTSSTTVSAPSTSLTEEGTTTTAPTATTEMETTESPTTTTTTTTTTNGDDFEICSSSMACLALEPYSSIPGFLQWCCENCAQGHCPVTHCICIHI